jgi:hypothetical protein
MKRSGREKTRYPFEPPKMKLSYRSKALDFVEGWRMKPTFLVSHTMFSVHSTAFSASDTIFCTDSDLFGASDAILSACSRAFLVLIQDFPSETLKPNVPQSFILATGEE